MTSGEAGFEYNADSVVAKLSIDVPAGAAEDLHQISQQAEQLRVQLEAITRAEQGWIEYLQQVPQLTEQAAAAQRNLITQLERTSYLQQQLGSMSGVAAPATAAGGGGQAPYSTAAPAGYQDQFGTAVAGMGAGRESAQAPQQVAQIAQQDPRLYANMAAQRGHAMPPGMLAGLGGLVTGELMGKGRGGGSKAPGDTGPQATNKARQSAAEPDQDGSPADATPPSVGQVTESVLKEMNASGGPMTLSGLRAGAGYLGRGGLGSAAQLAADSGLAGMLPGSMGDSIKRTAEQVGGPEGLPNLGALGKVAAGVGGGALAAGGLWALGSKAQGLGEEYQHYKNLGSIRGGGFAQGMGYEMEARIMSLNPFIDLEQSRQVMQAGLREGYTGKTFDTVTKFMADNLKNMNLQVGDSVALLRSNVDKGKMSVTDLGKTLGALREESKTGRISLPEKIEQYKETSAAFAAQGTPAANLGATSNAINEAFKNDPVLARLAPSVAQAAVQNKSFQMLMAQANNVQGVTLPSTVIPKMNRQGTSTGEGVFKALQYLANEAKAASGGDDDTGAGVFADMLLARGISIDPAEAIRLYKQFVGTGGERAYQRGVQEDTAARAQAAKPGSQVGRIGGDIAKIIPGVAPAEKLWDFISHGGTTFADLLKSPFTGPIEAIKDIFSGGNKKRDSDEPTPSYEYPVPDSPRPIQRSQPTGTRPTEVAGTVSGNLRITVDQQGRVTAPQTVQISGHQKSVNAGYGSATLNNPGPADPTGNHSYDGWGNGGVR